MENVAGTSCDPYFCRSQRTDNLARLCQLILTICTDILRDVLSKYISPTNLENKLNKNKSLLENIFNKHQNIQIYPAANTSTRRQVRSKDFDISVLYILLRNICGISGHTGGWGKAPHNGDYCTSACIERIRMERNVVSAHSADGGMDKSTFMSHWKELKECIIHLEENETGGDMYERGVDCLYESDLNPTITKNCIEEMKIIKDELGITKGKVADLETTVVNVKRMIGKKIGHKAEKIENFVDKRQSESTEHLTSDINELRADIKKEIEGLRMELKRKNTDESNSLTKKIKDEFKALNSRVEELETNQCSTVHDRINGLEESIQEKVEHKLDTLQRSVGEDFSSKMEEFEEKLENIQTNIADDNPWGLSLSDKVNKMDEQLENIQNRIGDDNHVGDSLSAKVNKMDKQLENIQTRIGYDSSILLSNRHSLSAKVDNRHSLSAKVDNIHRKLGGNSDSDDFDYTVLYPRKKSINRKIKDIHTQVCDNSDSDDSVDSDGHFPYPRKKKSINVKIRDRLRDVEMNLTDVVTDRLRDIERNLTDVVRAHFHEAKAQNKETERDIQRVKALNLTRPKAIISRDNDELWTIKATNMSFTNRRNENFKAFGDDNFWAITENLDDSGIPIGYKWYQFEVSEDKMEQINQITVYENSGCGLMNIVDDRIYFFSKSQNSVRVVEAHRSPRTLFRVKERALALHVGGFRVLVAWDCMGSIRLSVYGTNGSKIRNIPTALAANTEIRRVFRTPDSIYILQNDLNVLSDLGNVIYTIPGGKDPHQIRDISFSLSEYIYIAYQKSIDVVDEEGNAVKQLSFEGNDTIKSIHVKEPEMKVGWESNTLAVYRRNLPYGILVRDAQDESPPLSWL